MFSKQNKYHVIAIILSSIFISGLFQSSDAFSAAAPGAGAQAGWFDWAVGGVSNIVRRTINDTGAQAINLGQQTGRVAVAPIDGALEALGADGVRQNATNVGRSVAMFAIMAIVVPVALYNLASYGIPGLLNVIGLKKFSETSPISNNQQYSYNINLPGSNGEGRTKVFNQYLASHFPRVLEKMMDLEEISQERKDLLTVYLMSLHRTMNQEKDASQKKEKLTPLMMINNPASSRALADALCADLGLEMLTFDFNASWLATYFSSFSGYHGSEEQFKEEIDKIEKYLDESDKFHAVYIDVSWMQKWMTSKLLRKIAGVIFNKPEWMSSSAYYALDKSLNKRGIYFLEMLDRHRDKVLLITTIDSIEKQKFISNESHFRKLIF